MKVTELQIGDWVMYNSKPIQVTSLYGKPTEYGEFVSNEIGWSYSPNTWVDGDFIEPIPLTPEILKLNGFEQKTDGWLRCEDKANELENYIFIQFRYQGDIRECEINYINIVKAKYLYVINYVHQLQHALRLCGLNELADNLKLEE